MRIAILGAGNVGGGLAAAAVKAGHDVVLTASTPAHAEQAALATGARAAATNTGAVAGADVVVLAYPTPPSRTSPRKSPTPSQARSSLTPRTRSTRPIPI